MGSQTTDRELTLSARLLKAVKVWQEMKADGARADADAVLEETVRAEWPKGREWHYLCDACDDTGWRYVRCTARARCGRRFCAQQPAYEHEYVTPCTCAKGQAVTPTDKAEQPIGAAGRVVASQPLRKLV